MVRTENFEKIEVNSSIELRSWLEAHHTQLESVWLVTYKKHVSERYVSTDEVLDELLSFGWIDGIRRKLDEFRTMQLISPRKSQHWTKTYKDRAAKLISNGKMTPAGLMTIKAAKSKGLWNFMEDVDALIIPRDLEIALENHPKAYSNFRSFGPASQRFVLRWIKLARTSQTRTKRIDQTAQLAAKGEKVPGS